MCMCESSLVYSLSSPLLCSRNHCKSHVPNRYFLIPQLILRTNCIRYGRRDESTAVSYFGRVVGAVENERGGFDEAVGEIRLKHVE